MREIKGDLFDTDTPVIGHGVNCDGLMGAGIAKVFKDKFPANHRRYRDLCKIRPTRDLTGRVFFYPENDKVIANLFTQDRPGGHARYDWVYGSLFEAVERLVSKGYRSLAIPQIGCGIGGLEVDVVYKQIEAVEAAFPGFEIEVYVL